MITFIFKGDFKYRTFYIYIHIMWWVWLCAKDRERETEKKPNENGVLLRLVPIANGMCLHSSSSNDLVILKIRSQKINALRVFLPIYSKKKSKPKTRNEQCENVSVWNILFHQTMKFAKCEKWTHDKPQPSNDAKTVLYIPSHDEAHTLNTKSQIKLLRNNHNLLKMLPLNNFVLIRKIVFVYWCVFVCVCVYIYCMH